MKDDIEQRLTALRQEYDKGQQLLVTKQEEVADLQQQLLRISGAIQVLEELLNGAGSTQE